MVGTFKVVPQWYQQLFNVHDFLVGKLGPAVYCLCTGKDIGTYGPDTRDSGDFLNTRVQGHYFHFCQALHRKVGELELRAPYRIEKETKNKIRILLATAFLPEPQVDTGVSLLEAGIENGIENKMKMQMTPYKNP
ncbi:hypothetical protein T4E_1987 [Trichinella pseudospiralis]|uniref:Uncharacterized protein n=1 Tax=Trichinella pseudospiralis TaxID=6337 RepID=A0A0V0YBJ6_TRIPS|nr:hypothetical protein T4E_1987 [Trichinella pseudospiralis]